MAPHSTNLPPTWAWSADNSLLGTPDFRSTKRHINWATLRYPDSGAGLLFQSNGSQNVRATVDGERIDCFITDWYGGTNAPGEWTESYGSGKLIKNGQLLESKVKFRFLPPSQWAERWGIGSRIDNVRISREPTAPGLRQFGEKTPGAFGTTALTCGVDKLTTETRRTRRTGRNMAERALPRNWQRQIVRNATRRITTTDRHCRNPLTFFSLYSVDSVSPWFSSRCSVTSRLFSHDIIHLTVERAAPHLTCQHTGQTISLCPGVCVAKSSSLYFFSAAGEGDYRRKQGGSRCARISCSEAFPSFCLLPSSRSCSFCPAAHVGRPRCRCRR